MKEKNLIKTNIVVGYVVKENVIDTEESTREGRNRRVQESGGGMCPGCGGKE